MPEFCYRHRCWLLSLLLGLSAAAHSLTLGDELSPLSIDSMPADFDYQVDGKSHLIFVYPLNVTSWKIKIFHRKVIAAGYCPQSIVDMSNRAWYAPLSLAEKELAKEMKESTNPACSVTADYDGMANKLWGLSAGPVSIVVNGAGRVVFFAYGVLNEKQEAEVLALLASDNPEKDNPDKNNPDKRVADSG